MNIRIYLSISILFFFTSAIVAQEVVLLRKEEVLSKIADRNLSLKISQQEVKEAKALFNQTNALYLPSITASHTAIQTTNPLMAFGSKLNQGILTPNDFNPSLLNTPSTTQNVATLIQVSQPILNFNGLYQRKAAKATLEAKSLQSQRTTNYLRFEVHTTYMKLQLAYKGVEVLEKTAVAAAENLKLVSQNFEKGYVQRADVLLVELRLNEIQNQLQAAKSAVQNTSDYMSFLMGNTLDVLYKPADSLYKHIELEASIQFTENRADIKAMAKATDAYKAMYTSDKMSFLPKLNAFGSYELYDDTLFKGGASGYVVGAQLSWSLFEGSKRIGKTQKSKAAFEKAKLEYDQYRSKSTLEFNKVKRMLTDAEHAYSLGVLALQQAKESLRIRTNRFREGLEKTADLLAAEAQYAQRQLAYYQAIYEVNYAQYYINFLTQE